jgi:hypothetical protein
LPPTDDWHDDVLDQLDAAQEEFLLPNPGNVNFPGARVRMDAFASDVEWILVMQMLAWHRAAARFVITLTVFGNDIAADLRHGFVEPIHAVAGERLFGETSEDFDLDLHDFTVVVNGRPKRYEFTEGDYEASGIDLRTMAAPLAFLRILADSEQDDLLLSPEALLDMLGRQGLDHLFTLHEWRHPDEAEDELPSETSCFQEIARVIADRSARTPSSCSDGANTHWSRWLRYER